jgi:hypothetical protein
MTSLYFPYSSVCWLGLLSTEALVTRPSIVSVSVHDSSPACGLFLGTPFPPKFVNNVKVIFKRLFRVYAHIYHSHFQKVVDLGAEAHLNTCFKHFIYFVYEFRLISSQELAPLQDLISSLMGRDS